MDRELIQQRVTKMLSETLDMSEDEVSDQQIDLRDDLGMDSIDFVDLIELLEGQLGQTVEREQLTDVRTISDVVDLVGDLMSKRDVATPGTAQ
ncbi:acyl carrier protein [Nocardia sp. NBC_01499]|uniref:acyl carrier protein n=1 Tax=Nocardia sp. NBC_01499 TaxID=2903597 RepID=UPI00386F5D17